MTTILITVILGMVAYITKSLIDTNALLLQITKDKEVIKVPNDLEKNYQFIKGLY
jgi:hypothetical protein